MCVIGPNSRDLMQQLTGLKMGIKDFPYFTYKEVDAWMANGVRMLHMTHTGEMGWVMYIPNEVSLFEVEGFHYVEGSDLWRNSMDQHWNPTHVSLTLSA